MGDDFEDFFDDDDDDAFFNDADVLAQLDEVETQFANTQKTLPIIPPPSKRLKAHHQHQHQPTSASNTRGDVNPMAYGGPAVYVDESGTYHNYQSPNLPHSIGRTLVSDHRPSKVSAPPRAQAPQALVTRTALINPHPKGSLLPKDRGKLDPSRTSRESTSETRKLSLGMQALTKGTATPLPGPPHPVTSSRPSENPSVRPNRPPSEFQPRLARDLVWKPPWAPAPAAKLNPSHSGVPSPNSAQPMEIDHPPGDVHRPRDPLSVVDMSRPAVVAGSSRSTLKPLFRPDHTPNPSSATSETERAQDPHKAKDLELERMRLEIESVKRSLREANLERTRLRGEVSIVRSSLENQQNTASEQLRTLRLNEQKTKGRAEAAEKELERVQRAKETSRIFNGLEASARKPPSSVRKPQPGESQRLQSQMLPPALPFKGKVTPQKQDQAPSFRGFRDAFDVSDFPAPDSQRPRSHSQQNTQVPLTSVQADPFADPGHSFGPSLNPSLEPLPSQNAIPVDDSPASGRGPMAVSHRIVANMLYSFIVNVKPGSTASESDLVVALQFILQTEFEDSVNRAKFNRLSRDVFSHLGESMSCDWSNVKDGDEEVTKLVVGLGGSMLQLTQLFYETRLLDAMSVSVSILTTLCETTPLFCSLYLEHPELKQGYDIIPLIVRLVNEFGEVDRKTPDPFRIRLMKDVLDLIESLAWGPTEHGVSRLTHLLETEFVFDILVNSAQPNTLLYHALCILILMASERTLVSSIFLVPLRLDPDPHHDASRTVTRAQATSPMIERLTSMMIGPSEVPMQVLRLLTLLASADESEISQMNHSPTLIAMLIRRIGADCSVLWNGDGGRRHRLQMPICLDRLDLAMQLMFQVVFRPGATVSFMTHIKRASYHHLTGIYHEFISGLAKMAYSDVPGTGYFNEQQESRLDLIGDMAYDMIESLASPDEIDDMYDCCDDDVSGGSQTREEAVEEEPEY